MSKPKLYLFNKPFRVLSQFTTEDNKDTLAQFISIPDIYAAGRLDYDSEGLLLLTDTGAVQHLIASPSFKMEKTYWVQVEGQVTSDAITALERGVELKDGKTLPAKCELLTPPGWLWPRVPPIRERANIPTSWIALSIREGKNRQVRRMTAAVGFPTLRLVRYAIGPYSLESLSLGEPLALGEAIEVELTKELQEQVHAFQQKPRKSAASHGGRHREKRPALSGSKGTSGRQSRVKPTRRTRGK